jgi:diguanylate cyclase (GGDEF)-like protein
VSNQTLLLCYIDLDGFKQVNDRYGHDAGDQTLRELGARIKAFLRSTDCFGRIGGDEFAWLAPVESPEAAPELARTLHRRLIRILTEQRPELGCSLGAVIVSPGAKPPLTTLMHSADQLMYVAKRAGPNQLRMASAFSQATKEPVEDRRTPHRMDADHLAMPTLFKT